MIGGGEAWGGMRGASPAFRASSSFDKERGRGMGLLAGTERKAELGDDGLPRRRRGRTSTGPPPWSSAQEPRPAPSTSPAVRAGGCHKGGAGFGRRASQSRAASRSWSRAKRSRSLWGQTSWERGGRGALSWCWYISFVGVYRSSSPTLSRPWEVRTDSPLLSSGGVQRSGYTLRF